MNRIPGRGRSLRSPFWLAGLAAWVVCGVAAVPAALSVQDAWIRVPPGADAGAAYLTLHNTGTRPVTVVRIHTPRVRTLMIHRSQIEGGISRMRPAGPLRVLPGQLGPGGLHVMLTGLAQQLVPLVLELDDGSSVRVNAQVRPLSAQ